MKFDPISKSKRGTQSNNLVESDGMSDLFNSHNGNLTKQTTFTTN